jgi:hypothetical protein
LAVQTVTLKALPLGVSMYQLGQKRHFDLLPATSDLPRTTNIVGPVRANTESDLLITSLARAGSGRRY